MTLIDCALEQIQRDVANEDLTAIEELLQHIDPDLLKGFLSEDDEDNEYYTVTGCDPEEYEYEDDGQPDEAQEWHDFDPDC